MVFFWFALQSGYTPLHQAAQQGNTHVINVLLQHGAKPNATTVVRMKTTFRWQPPPHFPKRSEWAHSLLGCATSIFLIERKHGSVYRQTSGLHLCGGHAESCDWGGHHHHHGNLLMPEHPEKHSSENTAYFFLYSRVSPFVTINVDSHQTVTEKHKLNVPETMTEVLDVSDEEGETF